MYGPTILPVFYFWVSGESTYVCVRTKRASRGSRFMRPMGQHDLKTPAEPCNEIFLSLGQPKGAGTPEPEAVKAGVAY